MIIEYQSNQKMSMEILTQLNSKFRWFYNKLHICCIWTFELKRYQNLCGNKTLWSTGKMCFIRSDKFIYNFVLTDLIWIIFHRGSFWSIPNSRISKGDIRRPVRRISYMRYASGLRRQTENHTLAWKSFLYQSNPLKNFLSNQIDSTLLRCYDCNPQTAW